LSAETAAEEGGCEGGETGNGALNEKVDEAGNPLDCGFEFGVVMGSQNVWVWMGDSFCGE